MTPTIGSSWSNFLWVRICILSPSKPHNWLRWGQKPAFSGDAEQMNRCGRVKPPDYKEPPWTRLQKHAPRPPMSLSMETLSISLSVSGPVPLESSLLLFVWIFVKVSQRHKIIRGVVYNEKRLIKHEKIPRLLRHPGLFLLLVLFY